jgi:hypothetical protein
MAKLRLEVGLQSRGASLRTIGRELRDMDQRKVTGLFRDAIEPVARRYVPRVRASVMAIPVIPEGKQTGLRARIAACAETATWGTGREVNVAVQVNPQRMPEHEKGLPLYMEGVAGGRINHARWRHPVFQTPQNPDTWVQQPSHPFFGRATDGYGRAAGDALKAALEDITRKING